MKKKQTKKTNRNTKYTLRVRTGLRSGISDCCKAYLAYNKQNGNTFLTESDCPPDSSCLYIPVSVT